MSLKTVVTFLLIVVGILVGAVALLWKFGNTEVTSIPDIAGNERHVKGEGTITIVEFSDFQCPACRSVQEPLKQLLAKYQSRVKLVYRHFPLSTIHKNAIAASQASEAAYKQNKFWEMHDLLFEKQAEWQGESDPKAKFVEYASSLGLNKDLFVNDMDSQEVRDAVNADSLAATRYNLRGTPTFFVNGLETDFNQIEAKIVELSQ